VEIIRYTADFPFPAGWSGQSYDLIVDRYGLWISRRYWPSDAAEVATAAAEIEELGFRTIWLGGSPPDDLALAERILAATRSLKVGTSIVDIWTADAGRLSESFARIETAHPGRFTLGVGSGHAPTAEGVGETYVRPLARLREFMDALDGVPKDRLVLAALGPKALDLAATAAAGAVPYLVPPAHTTDARAALGPGRLLVPEQKIFLGEDPVTARAAARRGTAVYLTLPNYTKNLLRYGLSTSDFSGDGSGRWTDTLVAWGSEASVKSRVDEHLAAGADQVALQVLSASPARGRLPLDELRAAARVFL
jgi:probable F420-dependent oxidoreductase